MGLLYKIAMNNDKIKAYSLGLNIALIAVVLFLLIDRYNTIGQPCDELVRIDTIHVKDTEPKEIYNAVPVPDKQIAVSELGKKKYKHLPSVKPIPGKVDTAFHVGVYAAEGCAGVAPAAPTVCDTINLYSDTLHQADNYTAIINDTVQGRILGRSVYFVNLKPQVEITRRVKERWKVYVGVNATYNASYLNRWGIGPSALLTIPKIGGISYTYDVHNNAHTGGLYALLRFKK